MLGKFVEITKVNSHGEIGKALLSVERIVGIKEIHVEPLRLYDENCTLVSETPRPKEFTIRLTEGDVFHIDENEYNRLVGILTEQEGK